MSVFFPNTDHQFLCTSSPISKLDPNPFLKTPMKPFSPKTLLPFSPLSSPLFLQISHLSASQNNPCTVSPYRRHHEEDSSRNVRVSVWWDFENCGVPAGANVFKVASNIFSAVRGNGIKGSIQITAFGDMLQLSRSNQEALSATGVRLAHIPRDAGGKNSADRSLLVDLMNWVSENPSPAHLFLISSDRGFSNILHRLRMKNYNILLASTDEAPNVLHGAATITWQWQDLASGKNFAGKHFNRPPDGPYGSWYGHYKAPLEDPFTVIEQPACSQIEEPVESSSDSKLRPVPKTVLKQISKILKSHPEGISISDLRAELGRHNVSVDRDLYGHKRFSRFFLSMPQILKLEDDGSGRYMVRGIIQQSIEPVGLDSGLSTDAKIGDRDVISQSLHGTDNSISEPLDNKVEDQNLGNKEACGMDESIANAADGKRISSTHEAKMEKPSPEVQEASKPSEKIVELLDEQLTDGISPPTDRQDPSRDKMGFLQKIRRWWFGGESESEERNDEECIGSGDSQKPSHQHIDAKRSSDDENKCVKSRNPNVAGDRPVPSCSTNGSSSLFTNKSSQSDSTKQLECEGQKIPRGVSVSSPTSKQPVRKPKIKILQDCQKLMKEIMNEHPQGYNIGYFRKEFHNRHGYSFNPRELGYGDLASLLQALPGVKLESYHIFPAGNSSAKPAGYSSHTSKSDKLDAQWEDLGPVATKTSRSKPKPASNAAVEAPTAARRADSGYEPLASDDSNVEEDKCAEAAAMKRAKRPSGGEDNSLLQILDSWYSKEEGERSKGKQEAVDGMVDCSGNGLKPSDDSFEVEPKHETCSTSNERKQKPMKSYSFVCNKERDIDKVLGSWKKAGQSGSGMYNS